MALRARSKFLYGYQITPQNAAIDFRGSSGGPILQATARVGYYSLTSLMLEVARAINLADPDHTYTLTADRTIAGGTENRITIASDGTYLDLLFASGPRASSSIRYLIGFAAVDRTGATSYVGNATTGTSMISTQIGYNYLGPQHSRKVFGAVNVSASGRKETVTFAIQQFCQVQFKHEPETRIVGSWVPLLEWMIQQRLFEFTPEISNPGTFYEVTLERSGADGKGLAYGFREMLPQFPFYYDLGLLMFRLNAV